MTTWRKHLTKMVWAPMIVFLVFGLIAAAVAAAPGAESEGAAAKAQPVEKSDTAWIVMSAAIVVGISCLGAAYAVGHVGSAAMGAASERPELMGRALIFVGLAEGIAIYGLIIGIMLLRLIK